MGTSWRYLVIGVVMGCMSAVAIPATAQVYGGQPAWGQGRGDQDDRNSQAYRDGYRDGIRDMRSYGTPRTNNSNRWGSQWEARAYQRGYQDGFNQEQRQQASNNGRGRGRYGRDGDWRGSRNRRDGDDYGRNGNYGRNGDYGYGRSGIYGYGQNGIGELQRQAQQTGYLDGQVYAQQDLQRGNSNNPMNAKGYRDADHNYNSSLGSKDEYQRVYRQAFIDGYRRVYR